MSLTAGVFGSLSHLGAQIGMSLSPHSCIVTRRFTNSCDVTGRFTNSYNVNILQSFVRLLDEFKSEIAL